MKRDKRLFAILNRANRLNGAGNETDAAVLYTYYRLLGGKKAVPILSRYINDLASFTYRAYSIIADEQINSSVLVGYLKSVVCTEGLGIRKVDASGEYEKYIIWTNCTKRKQQFTFDIKITPKGEFHGGSVDEILNKLVYLVAITYAGKDQTITDNSQIEYIVARCVSMIQWIFTKTKQYE